MASRKEAAVDLRAEGLVLDAVALDPVERVERLRAEDPDEFGVAAPAARGVRVGDVPLERILDALGPLSFGVDRIELAA